MSRTIIIGGGVTGLSVAYHLAKRGCDNVLLLERNELTSGTSWHAAGIVGPLRATPGMTRLAMQAISLFPRLETETGMSTGYKRSGGFWLAREAARLDELKRIASLGQHLGLQSEMISAESAASRLPGLDLSGHVGALAVAEDANVNPVDLCMAYAHAARKAGVQIREQTQVDQLVVREGFVHSVDLGEHGTIEASTVVLCAGAWSRPLAESAGLALPLQAVEHMYVVTEPVAGLAEPFPVIRDLDSGIYIKGDAGNKLVIGGFEPDAKCWDAFGPEGDRSFLELPEDWDQFGPFMQAALNLVPALEHTGIQRFMNGPESFTMDTRPLVGEAPQVSGLFVAAGMNSVGIMSSAGIGQLLGDWIADGKAPADAWEVDIRRADPLAASASHMQERMQEAVSDLFALHWPFKQPASGRGLRKSVLHDHWQKQGAVFGVTAGWERGLWYARDKSEEKLPYSTGKQHWQAIAEREAAVMQDGVCLLDLSPFSKFDVTGSDALLYLQQLTCSDMNVDAGTVLYTLVLNSEGGIEAEVTVTRLAEKHFRITSGAATRWRDTQVFKRCAAQLQVVITDVTEEESVIGVMGAGSRDLLAQLSGTDWGKLQFSTARTLNVNDIQVRATRLSYIGEPGWELNIDNASAGAVFDVLIKAGAQPMGHYALDACRLEKGYTHWGHDIGPEVTALEAGLGFTIDWEKDFTGKRALQRQREQGIQQRLCLFQLDGEPLVLHDEPVFESGRVVGLSTSGGKGVRTGLTLAFALISTKAGETRQQTSERQFEFEIACVRYPARALVQPPFDPRGNRMRA